METKEIIDRLNAVVCDKLDIDSNEIKPDGKWFEMGADSLDTVELVMEVEREFNIIIPQDEFEKVDTYNKLVSFIKNHV